jgi:hypothetical protein
MEFSVLVVIIIFLYIKSVVVPNSLSGDCLHPGFLESSPGKVYARGAMGQANHWPAWGPKKGVSRGPAAMEETDTKSAPLLTQDVTQQSQ